MNCLGAWATYMHMTRMTRIKNPSTMVFMTDGMRTSAGVEGGQFCFYTSTYPFTAGSSSTDLAIDFRHPNLNVPCLFAEGHVNTKNIKDMYGNTNCVYYAP